MKEAAEQLDRAIVLFPPQKSIDDFHPLFGQAMAWRFSVKALAESEDLASALDTIDKDLDADAMCRWDQSRPANCKLDWETRSGLVYPRSGLNRGEVGSVLVGYDVNESGVERTVVIAGVNGEKFAEAATTAMKTWRLKEPVPAECRTNHLTTFSFILEN